MKPVENLPTTERDMVRVIVKRIYGQTSIRLTEEQIENIVDSVLEDNRWVELTEKIENMIYLREKI